jgi:hypothetical protein
MSSEQEEEHIEYVDREEPVQVSQPVVAAAPGTVVRETVVRNPTTVVPSTPVVSMVPPESERKESVVRRTNTNTGAIVAMIVGAVILLFGILLVFTKVFPYLTYPWSLVAVLIVAVVLMAIGASLLQTRTTWV